MPQRLANLLLIDDSLQELILASEMLEFDNIHLNFTSVRSGSEAMNYLRRCEGYSDATRPDLILMDINMPEMLGTEILPLIKKEDEFKDIDVIIYSGSDTSTDIDIAKELGAAHYIVKPLRYAALAEAVDLIDTLEFIIKGDDKYLFCKAD